MSATIYQHWQKKNARQKDHALNGQTLLAAAVCVVIADTVAAYREIVLLRLTLSLTASHSY